MKKIYQAPLVSIENIVMESLVCASLGSGATPNVDLTEAEEAVGGISGDSRFESFWDSDD